MDMTLSHWQGCNAARPVAEAFVKGQTLPRKLINVTAPIWTMGPGSGLPLHVVFEHTDSTRPVALAVHTQHGVVVREDPVNSVQNDSRYHCSAASMVHFIKEAAVEAGVEVFEMSGINLDILNAVSFAAQRALLRSVNSPL